MKRAKVMCTAILGLALMLSGGARVDAGTDPCNLIQNGDFTAGAQYWHIEEAVSVFQGTAYLNGQGTKSDALMTQTVTIPGQGPWVSDLRLYFDLRITTLEKSSYQYDTLYFWIYDWNTMHTAEMYHYSNVDAPAYSTFRTITLPMSRYIGHKISIFFEGIEDVSRATRFEIDNVSIKSPRCVCIGCP